MLIERGFAAAASLFCALLYMPTCPPVPLSSFSPHQRGHAHQHRQVKVVETAEAVVKEAEEEHARLQKEYQDMCAGVATEKEGSRTLTDQVRRELN